MDRPARQGRNAARLNDCAVIRGANTPRRNSISSSGAFDALAVGHRPIEVKVKGGRFGSLPKNRPRCGAQSRRTRWVMRSECLLWSRCSRVVEHESLGVGSRARRADFGSDRRCARNPIRIAGSIRRLKVIEWFAPRSGSAPWTVSQTPLPDRTSTDVRLRG